MRAKRRAFRLYPALLAMGAGVLLSCAAEPPPRQWETVAVASPPVSSPDKNARLPPAPRPARKPAPPTERSDDETIAMTVPRPGAEPTAPGPLTRPNDLAPGSAAPGAANPPAPPITELIGLDQPAATRLLGPAAERSEAPPATVWRYRNADCQLDLFFYLDLRSGSMRTLHYSLKDDGDPARRQNCLRSLLASPPG
jgi:hypothetical protein